VLTEAFIETELPRLLPPQRTGQILEVGCGSGRLSDMLWRQGYRGSYTGIDVTDRYVETTNDGLAKRFMVSDAQTYQPPLPVDLVISVSVLEHIPDDRTVTDHMRAALAPGGLQVHFVPSGCGLFVYLWHGWRQYTRGRIGTQFEPQRTTVYALGGLFSTLLHVTFITGGEMILRLPMRRRLTGLYVRLLDTALRLDRFVPVGATMFVICERAPGRPT
jgi:2-polyprenyl-3-methyl-5-hydroxy-6-metoxy-1,4-benzoquinol methylase